jgi:hypothetical protein
MEFRCEDLAEHGLQLVPPSSAEYEALLSDVQRRMEIAKPGFPPMPNPFRNPLPERDRNTAAILLNRSGQGIVAMRFVWRFEGGPEQVCIRSGTVLPCPQMFPLNWPANFLAPGIMPGSKRYLACGYAFGDNSDVLPALKQWKLPEFSEIEEHGSTPEPDQASLSLDGVFFADGAFAGANRYHLWEQVVFAAEERRSIGELAQDGALLERRPRWFWRRSAP